MICKLTKNTNQEWIKLNWLNCTKLQLQTNPVNIEHCAPTIKVNLVLLKWHQHNTTPRQLTLNSPYKIRQALNQLAKKTNQTHSWVCCCVYLHWRQQAGRHTYHLLLLSNHYPFCCCFPCYLSVPLASLLPAEPAIWLTGDALRENQEKASLCVLQPHLQPFTSSCSCGLLSKTKPVWRRSLLFFFCF